MYVRIAMLKMKERASVTMTQMRSLRIRCGSAAASSFCDQTK